MFETLDPFSSSSSSSGVAMVEPNARLGAVVRKSEGRVALATPTERRRRDGLERQVKLKLVKIPVKETRASAHRDSHTKVRSISCQLDPGRWSSSWEEDLCSH